MAPVIFALAVSSFATTETQPLRVVADDDYPPYAFRDSAGTLQGIVVDQWREWERATGRRVDLVGLPWDQALLRMKAGEADVIDTMFETPGRRALYDFCPAYAKIDSSVFFYQTISGLADLLGPQGLPHRRKGGGCPRRDSPGQRRQRFRLLPQLRGHRKSRRTRRRENLLRRQGSGPLLPQQARHRSVLPILRLDPRRRVPPGRGQGAGPAAPRGTGGLRCHPPLELRCHQ